MNRFIVISGCSGGGKSTLIEALRQRGHAVVAEAGRRVVRAEMATGGSALPWRDMEAFCRRAIALALDDRERAATLPGPVFFDRGIVDVAAAMQRVSGLPVLEDLGRRHRYADPVLMAPPWPELFRSDPERQHDFAAARAEYVLLRRAYSDLSYRLLTLPRCPVDDRADWLERRLATIPPCRDWP